MARTALPVLTASDIAQCCAPVTGGALDDATADRLAHLFKALGDPTRVKLLSLIAAGPDGEACICDLTEPVELSQPTVSHHMKLLVDAGLVSREQRGKWAYYRVITDTLVAISESLAPHIPATDVDPVHLHGSAGPARRRRTAAIVTDGGRRGSAPRSR